MVVTERKTHVVNIVMARAINVKCRVDCCSCFTVMRLQIYTESLFCLGKVGYCIKSFWVT